MIIYNEYKLFNVMKQNELKLYYGEKNKEKIIKLINEL